MATRLLAESTHSLIQWVHNTLTAHGSSQLTAEVVALRLGAQQVNQHTVFGFWVPELAQQQILNDDIQLELFSSQTPFSFNTRQQLIAFRRQRLPIVRDGDYLWGVYEGVTAGNRTQLGHLYWIRYRDQQGKWQHIHDPLAYSQPFGSHAPAEFYDRQGLERTRTDADYFCHAAYWQHDDDHHIRMPPPSAILQLHVPTATPHGSFAGLTRLYQGLADKVRKNARFSATDYNFLGYDALQLLPIELIAEPETVNCWHYVSEDEPEQHTVAVMVQRPYIQNWGYDTLISGTAAINPALLDSARPDEFVEFIATLHNFPQRPIRLILDIVLNHAHPQAQHILNPVWLAGNTPYGIALNMQQPMVRALLLELVRRKLNWGIDGLRIDAAQDIRYWDSEQQHYHYDDAFLQALGELRAEVCGQRYRPWLVFEDGRPHGQGDWPLTARYQAVTQQLPEAFQWGALTFALNAATESTFWLDKAWRVQEIAQQGSHWINGFGNHDTLRRAAQHAQNENLNRRLGKDLPSLLHNAYDHPAAMLLTHSFLPGVPQDFLAVTSRAPWSFFRQLESDDSVISLLAREAVAFPWLINAERYSHSRFFPRLKALGLTDYHCVHRLMQHITHFGAAVDYQPTALMTVLNVSFPPLQDTPFNLIRLRQIAQAWFTDLHDYCQIAAHWDQVSLTRTRFYYELRQFRRNRSWLQDNLMPNRDQLAYHQPSAGSTLYYGWRQDPQHTEQLGLLANMAGESITITPATLLGEAPASAWRLVLATTDFSFNRADEPLTLHNAQAVLLKRNLT